MLSYKARVLNPAKIVKVYRNLHPKTKGAVEYSVKQGGLVIGHAEDLYLKDVVFKVSEAGRQRVIAEQRKNVHATVEGYVVSKPLPEFKTRVSYNPYKAGYFVCEGEPVKSAGECTLTKRGVYVDNNKR